MDACGWVTKQGLLRLEEETGTFPNLHQGEIFAVSPDLDPNQLWLGSELGLVAFQINGGAARTHVIDTGRGGHIAAILVDRLGKPWLSMDRGGVMRFDPASETFQIFSLEDGLQSNHFTRGSAHAGNDGLLYLGGLEGLNVFDPAKIKPLVSPAAVVLTRVSLFQKPQLPRWRQQDSLLEGTPFFLEQISLDHRQKNLSLDFAVMNFAAPRHNRIAYKLDGVDPDWVENSEGDTRVIYNHLAPGEYQLRVRGGNKHGIDEENEYRLTLKVGAHPLQTPLAYVIYALSALGICALYVGRTRRELARQTQLAERLQRLDHLKDEFLANTSHELRTPLNGILGLADSLADGVHGRLPAAARADLAMIISSTRRLTNLVNDILDFSKTREKGLKLHCEPIILAKVVEDVLALSEPLAAPKGLSLNHRVPDTLTVWADEARLIQILSNLVDNGIKFSERGSVQVDAVRLGDEQVRITVKDTGMGIAPAHQKDIFNAFEQLDGSETRLQGGTGLGLAITRQLVELHKGSIQVDSKPGEGAAFSFTLPAVPREVAMITEPLVRPRETLVPETEPDVSVATVEPAEETASREADQPFKLLIVDDNPMNRQVLANYLAHYQLEHAADGREAVDLVAQKQFDLILMDVMMPRMSGFEACCAIRKHYAPSSLPILFLTAKDQVLNLVKAFEFGANDYLTKPVIKEELVARVRTTLTLLDSARKLEAYNRNLEQQVRERTASLEEKRRELENLDKVVKIVNREVTLPALAKTLLGQAISFFPNAEGGFVLESLDEGFQLLEGRGTESYTSGQLFENERVLEDFLGGEVSGNHQQPHPHLEGAFLLSIPLLWKGDLAGMFGIIGDKAFTRADMQRADRLREHVATAVMKARMLHDLMETTRRLEEAQARLVESAHNAGKAETAVRVLHHIGNAVNSLKTSAFMIGDYASEDRLSKMLEELARLLEENSDDLVSFFQNDQRAGLIPAGLGKISRLVKQLLEKINGEAVSLQASIEEVQEVLSLQEKLIENKDFYEELDPGELLAGVVDGFRTRALAQEIQLIFHPGNHANLSLQRFQVVKVLETLIGNAVKAAAATEARRVLIGLRAENTQLVMVIEDTGTDLAGADPQKLFMQREDRRGPRSDLHECAVTMHAMGGRIQVEIEDTGTRFLIGLPSSSPDRPRREQATQTI